MNLINSLLLMTIIINSRQNVIKNMTECNQTGNSTTNSNGTVSCPSFSQLICPTKCDPSCKRPLIKRSMCRQPITCSQKACVCGPDYVKDNEKKCIPRERCSENCPPNEIFRLCPLSCEIHCGNYKNPPKHCPEDEREDHDCIAGCDCPTGLIRDYSNGKCVNKENCTESSTYSCPPNEEYKNCSSDCDKVCNRVNTYCNPKDKCKSGCFCQKGFIRQNINAKCIPEDHCLAESDIIFKPKKSNETRIASPKPQKLSNETRI